jgi:hypothetical protein
LKGQVKDMKLKTLLKTLRSTEYNILNENGGLLKEGYIGTEYYEDCIYEDERVIKITTINDKLYITIKY